MSFSIFRRGLVTLVLVTNVLCFGAGFAWAGQCERFLVEAGATTSKSFEVAQGDKELCQT